MIVFNSVWKQAIHLSERVLALLCVQTFSKASARDILLSENKSIQSDLLICFYDRHWLTKYTVVPTRTLITIVSLELHLTRILRCIPTRKISHDIPPPKFRISIHEPLRPGVSILIAPASNLKPIVYRQPLTLWSIRITDVISLFATFCDGKIAPKVRFRDGVIGTCGLR